MRNENRVAWSEGMFLRVQHFQQADRWTERLVRTATHGLSPYPWGVAEIGIDRGALAIGQFALSNLRGVLPDGTPFEAPVDTDLPPPLDLDENTKNAIVYLALPARQPGKADVALNGGAARNSVRLVASPYEAPDANVETDFMAPIDVGRLSLRYLRTGDEEEENPALGWRALRLALDRDALMKSQARALLEAASQVRQPGPYALYAVEVSLAV